MTKPLWKPSSERINNSNMKRFMEFVSHRFNLKIENYHQLYDWSIKNLESFWESLLDFSEIKLHQPYKKILSNHDLPGAKWFAEAKINFAENLLRFNDDHTAIISDREDCPKIKISYKDLNLYVNNVAGYLQNIGVSKNDIIAGYVSNIPEAIIAMLAAAKIGAIWSSCSPDFGVEGVVDRFGQIKPKVLFAVEEYQYNGKKIDCLEKIAQIKEKISSITSIILIEHFYDFKSHGKDNQRQNNFSNQTKFSEIINSNSANLDFISIDFNHPTFIMYSSGTTGKPKCIVHGAGGTLLQHFKELYLHTDLTRKDTITFYTTCGWMMWNWLVSSLFVGAAIYIYDGSPIYPNVNGLWKKVEENKITILGTSPKFLSICEKSGSVPKNKYMFRDLKTILSTGSPLLKDNFEFVYEKVKEDVQLSSISGGTDIISCFALGNPTLPVFSEEIQCRGLGMKVEAFNENGKSVVDEKGELVCTQPFPSMPIYFWNDPDGSKFHSAYFEYYPGVWRHGDYIKITNNKGVIIYGRSDSTLNPGGIRIGTGEIYKVVESFDEISDSIAVAQKWNNDERIILFIVLKDKKNFTKEFEDEIKLKIKNETTSRHVPSKIIRVNDIPRTINGKKIEIAVARIINGEEITNLSTIANPESLRQFKGLSLS